jgi:hypothetical protein
MARERLIAIKFQRARKVTATLQMDQRSAVSETITMSPMPLARIYWMGQLPEFAQKYPRAVFLECLYRRFKQNKNVVKTLTVYLLTET